MASFERTIEEWSRMRVQSSAPVNYESPELRQRRLYLEAKEREKKAREELELKLETVEFEE